MPASRLLTATCPPPSEFLQRRATQKSRTPARCVPSASSKTTSCAVSVPGTLKTKLHTLKLYCAHLNSSVHGSAFHTRTHTQHTPCVSLAISLSITNKLSVRSHMLHLHPIHRFRTYSFVCESGVDAATIYHPRNSPPCSGLVKKFRLAKTLLPLSMCHDLAQWDIFPCSFSNNFCKYLGHTARRQKKKEKKKQQQHVLR